MRTAFRAVQARRLQPIGCSQTFARASPGTTSSPWTSNRQDTFRASRRQSAIHSQTRSFATSICRYNTTTSPDYGQKQHKARGIPDFDLSGKVIIVTGGAGGLGSVQAAALLEAGATVYALDRRQDPGDVLSTLQKRAESEWGTELHYRQIDVRDNLTLNAVIEKIASDNGRLDGLLAAAGIQQETPALEMSQEDTNTILETNVTGVFMAAQAVARQMVKYGNGGSMALVASMSGYAANRGLPCAAYNSSKAAVHQLGRSLAAEWGQHGIRVNTFSPGYIVTPMVEALFDQYPDRKIQWPKDNMLNRVSRPEDYRGVAVYLMSDASSYMTGSDLRIDGGHMAW